MFYLICFISGLILGAGIMFAVYILWKWLPIVRAAGFEQKGETEEEKKMRQWGDMVAYTGYTPPKRELE